MNESIEPSELHCPNCGKKLESKYQVCPYCGLRLKPAKDLLVRSIVWFVVLIGYTLGLCSIAAHDRVTATYVAILIGLPLAYSFGKAVLFRINGTPLTWGQLSVTTVRAAFTSFALLVVLPILIGTAVLVFAFIACFANAPLGGR